VETSLHDAQTQLRDLLANLPQRPIAWTLGRILFPWGNWARPPDDSLGDQVAKILIAPSAARDRLTAGIYSGGDRDDVSGRLEFALQQVVTAAPIERRVRAAERAGSLPAAATRDSDLVQRALDAGIIDPDEARQLRAAVAATDRAIQVDDFPSSELSPANLSDHMAGEKAIGTVGDAPNGPTSATLIAKAS
jgi:acyl-CoA dehydrogenase